MGLAFTGIRRAGLAVGYGEKDRQPICMQRNAVRYRLSHACFARHDAVPIRRGFSLVLPRWRGVSVLRAFSEGRPAMTLPELAEATA